MKEVQVTVGPDPKVRAKGLETGVQVEHMMTF